MFDSDIEDGDNVSDYVCSDGEEEEMEDIEVFKNEFINIYIFIL